MIGPMLATLEDCLPIAEIHHVAFAGADLPLYNHIWGKCAVNDLHAFRMKMYRSALCNSHSQTRILVMRDGPTDKVISFAMWTSPKTDSGNFSLAVNNEIEREEEGNGKHIGTQVAARVFPSGYNAAVMAKSGEQSTERDAYLLESRDKMWNLAFLATKPGYEGRGAAKELVRWGFTQADIDSRRCAVSTDADSTAFKFYESMGFQVVGPVTLLDFQEFGGEGILKYVTMVREPSSKIALGGA